MHRRLLIILVLLSSVAFGYSENELNRVANSKYWLRLLHYKPSGIFPTNKSLVDGPEFFFSPDGKTNPKAELVATIEAFSKNLQIGRLKQHPQCAFPERFRFIKEELKIKAPVVECEKYREYISKFKAKSATLVFSSAYPNNPGSMFGHTFLRVNSGQRESLLDYGISFAAVVPKDENTVLYMAMGLLGGYKGQYSMLPYYSKVNEYINSESRDLWEYDLNLTTHETERMLSHLWEIETNSWFDYYFFDENCSYQLLAAIEVARPDWELTDFGPYVAPAETVKKLTNIPGAIKQIRFRPSLRKKLVQSYEALSSEQKDLYFSALETSTSAKELSDKFNDAAVLDTLALHFQYLKQKQEGVLSEDDSKLLKLSLLKRSKITTTKSRELTPIPEDTRPDLGHNPYRIGISGGQARQMFFNELEFKFAYHDLFNKDLGYTKFSQIDFPHFTVRYTPKLRLFNVENITGAAVTSLFPLSFLEKRASWRFAIDYYSPKDFGCNNCHALRLETGAGFTVELFTKDALFYTLLLPDIEVGSTFAKGFRLAPKLRSAFLAELFSNFKIGLGANLVWDIIHSQRQPWFYQVDTTQSFSISQSLEVRGHLSTVISPKKISSNYLEEKITLNLYF
ncbi:MAG: DUF4105 domain-containing protein [Bacteriovoracia bacterium]